MYKFLFWTLLIIVLIGLTAGGAYWYGRQQTAGGLTDPFKISVTPTMSAMPLDTGAPTQTQAADTDLVPQGQNTVSYARSGGKVLLKYRGKIYDETNQGAMEPLKNVNEADYKWFGLVDAPAGVPANEFMYDEVFGLKIAPNGSDFAFIMRWGTNKNDGESINYHIYSFKSGMLNSLISVPNSKNFIPKIDQYNSDGSALALNMFPCWNCGGGTPSKGLWKTSETGGIQDIGQVSYFKWTVGTNYEYKEYKKIECPPEQLMGECSEKPENLPMKTGTF